MLGLPGSSVSPRASRYALSSNAKRLLAFSWACVVFTFFLFSSSPSLPTHSLSLHRRQQTPELVDVPPRDVWKGKRVGVYEDQEYHDEVAGALMYSLYQSGIEPRVFRKSGFRFGFLQAVASFWTDPVWEKTHDGAVTQSLLENEVDVMVLSTCSQQIDHLLHTLLDPRSNVHVACLTHWGNDLKDNPSRYQALADQGRLSIVVLSDHVGMLVEKGLEEMALQNGEAAWDKVQVMTFVPTFPVDIVHRTHVLKPQPRRFPSKLGIQGNIHSSRRDYASVIASLHRAITLDPTAWGYKWSADRPEDKILIPIHERNAPEPFELHLLGNLEEELKVPEVMKGIVRIHQKLAYEEYYRILSEMDALLPAFSHGGYTWDMASSSIGAALIAKIPVLCSPKVAKKYAYLSGPALLPHPNSMDPIEAVRLYRAGLDAVEGTLIASFDEDGESWGEYLEKVEEANIQVWGTVAERVEATASS